MAPEPFGNHELLGDRELLGNQELLVLCNDIAFGVVDAVMSCRSSLSFVCLAPARGPVCIYILHGKETHSTEGGELG